jgi:peptidoglycan/LPS O-acetylase OafA/YrhL
MKFKYRSEIDGLRAIAVISVIIYHAEFTIRLNNVSYKVFPGGFLGVDIFYVISGYLITYLIYENIKKNSFLFLDFYERRARRLLPMLFLVISMSLVVGWMLMMPNQLKDFSGSALASLFFVSNFWFLITDSYFAESSALKPLLHTWSLSIEEQFYIIFPPFLYFLYKKKIRQIKLLFVVLILISLSLATLGSFYFTDINFYILPTRVWELLAGGILAFYHANSKTKKISKYGNLLSLLGVILILSSVFLFNANIPHPSFFSSFIILGTGLIIFFRNENGFIKKILSTNIFVGAGLISYSLYLWHFPVFAFKKIKSPNLSNFDKLETILLVIALSILSYYLVERPFRNRKIILKKLFFTCITIFFTFLLISCFYIYKKDGIPERYPDKILKLIDFKYNYSKAYQTGRCHIEAKSIFKKVFFEDCKIKIDANKKKLYLWGDSLGAHLYPGIKSKYKDKYNIWHRSADACKPILLFSENKKNSSCIKINKFIFNEIVKIKPDKIFLSAGWTDDDLIYIKKIIEKLRKNNINNIYLVGPSPRWHDPLPKLLLKRYRITKKIPEYMYDKNQVIKSNLDKKFSSFAKKNLIKYMSPLKILCTKDYKCLTKVGEEADSITNWDENHFTEKASIYIFSKFID